MPELPEVETTRAGLRPYMEKRTIQSVTIHRTDLRYPVSQKLPTILSGLFLDEITRRGKYLLFHCKRDNDPCGGLLWHLGMSGSLRLATNSQPLKLHDHIEIRTEEYCLRYNDPRRFGFVLWVDDFKTNALLTRLGPEPLSRSFSSHYLYRRIRKKKLSIKQVVMDYKIVVGIGNIYANEALFKAGINPFKPSNEITSEQCTTLVHAIKAVLRHALAKGGTTLKDFLQPDGKPGYFRDQLYVYGRANLPCLKCAAIIVSDVIGQRSTFWCPRCQK